MSRLTVKLFRSASYACYFFTVPASSPSLYLMLWQPSPDGSFCVTPCVPERVPSDLVQVSGEALETAALFKMRSRLNAPFDIEIPEGEPGVTLDELREAYRKIAAKETPKGGFLTAFAEAVVKADGENMRLLLPVMRQLAVKYDLVPEGVPHA